LCFISVCSLLSMPNLAVISKNFGSPLSSLFFLSRT
jgi:hypothetical protein